MPNDTLPPSRVARCWLWFEHHYHFERFDQELLSVEQFMSRLWHNARSVVHLLVAELTIGVVGYMAIARLSFIDALYNTAMLAGGQGPVDQMPSVMAKLWGSFYALFSGAFGMILLGFLIAPVWHRVQHRHRLANHRQPNHPPANPVGGR